jgi:hypothetical protein
MRVARFRRGDQGVFQCPLTPVRADRCRRLYYLGDRGFQQCARAAGIGMRRLDDHIHRDRIVFRMPAIVIGHHGDGGVAQLGFAREFGLRHVGHADDIAAPGAVQLGFGKT